VLIESAHQVGGTMTTGGVNFPGLFHAWGRQVIAGVGWELVTKAVALDDGRLPDFTRPTGRCHYNHQILINIPLFVALAEEALVGAGVTLHYHAAPVRIKALSKGWRVHTAAAGNLRAITCRQIVDCTGNGSAAALAGFERLQASPAPSFTASIPTPTSRNSTRTSCRRVMMRRSRRACCSAMTAAGAC
jgi:glycine/D-amino acid oxidase-like deaminating enzyme